MRSSFLPLAALIAMSQSSFAQSTTTATVGSTNVASPANSSIATSDAPAVEKDGVKPAIKYLGYMHGPGADFSGARQSGINDGDQMFYEQRFKFLIQPSKKFEAGLEARVNTNFGRGDQLNIRNGHWKIVTNFKDVLNNDVYKLSLQPRITLPTSNGDHNTKLLPSPDLIAELAIAPKNSRMSYDLGLEYLQYFHSDGANSKDYTNADTAIFAPWIEADYQLTPKTQLMLSYWPAWAAHARRGNGPMTSAFAEHGENEFDVGGYYEFAKGWQLNPFVAVETSGIGNAPNALQNMQLNLALSGAIL